MVHHVVAASIAMMIVAVEVEVGTVGMVAATTTAIVAPLATKIVSVVPTADVVMITVLAESTVTPLVVAMIAIAAVATTIVVVLSLTVEMVAEMVGALQLMRMPLQGRPETPMEVETKISVLTIGTLVDRLRSANLLRCGAFCQIAHPNLPTILACLRFCGCSTWRRRVLQYCYDALGSLQIMSCHVGACVGAFHLATALVSSEAAPRLGISLRFRKESASLVSFDSVEVSVGHADGFSASFVTLHGLVWSVVDSSARISFLRLRLKSASGASKSCATNVIEGPNQLLITL